MSIKIENLIKITTSGSYLYLTPEEYHALTGQVPSPTALKDINWNGPTPELVKDQRIYELDKELNETKMIAQKWLNGYKNLEDIRDKQKDEIEKLREKIAELEAAALRYGEERHGEVMKFAEERQDLMKQLREQRVISQKWKQDYVAVNEDRERLTAELEAMTLTTKGMVEKPYWRDLVTDILATPTDHGTAEVLRELLADGDIEPVEPTPPPAPEPIAEVVAAPETVPEPVESDGKYPAKKKKGFGVPPKNPFTAEQKEKYIALMKTKIPRKDIIATMAKDSDITIGNANSRYYALLQSITTDQAIKELDERTKKPEPVKPVPVKPEREMLPTKIMDQLRNMPAFDTVNHFKDALCKGEGFNLYPVNILKLAYRQSHKNLTW